MPVPRGDARSPDLTAAKASNTSQSGVSVYRPPYSTAHSPPTSEETDETGNKDRSWRLSRPSSHAPALVYAQ